MEVQTALCVASVEAGVEVAILADILNQLTWMDDVDLEIFIEAVGEPEPDPDHLMMIDTIAQVVGEAVVMMKAETVIEVPAAIAPAVANLRARDPRANRQPHRLPKMSETGVLCLCSNLLQGCELKN